ncbi:MAG: DUF2892 domain-containing protein [Candidatus Margulisiibacteriota bacterium]
MNEIKMNLSTADRFVRIIIGGGLLMLATYIQLGVPLTWAAIILGLILMLTGLAGYCPLYALLGCSTKK